jgi:hypothetical protein
LRRANTQCAQWVGDGPPRDDIVELAFQLFQFVGVDPHVNGTPAASSDAQTSTTTTTTTTTTTILSSAKSMAAMDEADVLRFAFVCVCVV